MPYYALSASFEYLSYRSMSIINIFTHENVLKFFFFDLSPTSGHLHPRKIENSISRFVVNEDDNGKVKFAKVKNTQHV